MRSLSRRTSRFLPSRLVAASLAAAFVVGCGSSEKITGDTTHTTPTDTVAASIAAVGALNQTGVAGASLPSPIQVVVKNKAGDAIKNKAVAFAVATGGGSVGSASVLTDGAGQASTTWVLGPSTGTQTATATVAGLTAVTFTATANAGAAAKIAKVAGDSQSVVAGTAVATIPTVKVTDANGNPVAGALVSFTIGSGGGTVVGSPVNSAADGTAKPTSWTLGKTAGANSLVATSGTFTATFTATGIAGAATSVQITSTNPTSLTPGQTTQLTVAATDANGNAVATAPTYASSNSAAVSVNSSGLVTGVASGSAIITATVGTAQASQGFIVVGHSGSIIYDTTALANSPGPAAVAAGDAFVAQTAALTVTRISPNGTVVATITLGGHPVDIAADPLGTKIVVAMAGVDQLSILDLVGNTAASSLSMPATPVRVVVSSTGKTAFVSMNNGQLAIVDLTTMTITNTMAINIAASALKLAPGGDTLLYAGAGSQIEALNLKTRVTIWTQAYTGTVGDIELSNTLNNGQPQYLYVANTANGNVDVFNTSDFSISGTYAVTGARYLSKTPDGAELYVSQSSFGKNLAMVIGVGNNLFSSRNVPTGGLPTRVVFEPAGTWAVIPNASGWVNFIH